MKVFFDESYPENQDSMILGALFLSNSAYKIAHKKITELKEQKEFSGELKYSQINTRKSCDLAKLIVKMFADLKMPYFSCSVLPYSEAKLAKIPGSNLNTKRVGLYSDSAKKLVRNGYHENTSVDLYMDREDRIAKTKFIKKVKKMSSHKGTKIKNVQFIDSSLKQNVVMQACDLLIGSVKQTLYPLTSKKGRYKREFAEYCMSTLKLKDISGNSSSPLKSNYGKTKFRVRHWKVSTFRYKKNRS